MARTVFHPAATRGHANHGWLNSYHTFSFAGYYEPQRMHFGALRVLNDDTVAGGMGFGRHPHDNMEIVSIALSGSLEHQDNMGNKAVIRPGDVQVMSAGTGVAHSEKNHSATEEVKFLQIWVIPNKRNVPPRYDQQTFRPEDQHNRLQQVLSPNADDEGVWLHQDAWFHLGQLDAGFATEYELKKAGNGVYIFVLEGDVTVDGQALHRRDGFGIWETDRFAIQADSAARVLLMEVPMLG
ncbi:pirin family protein [Hymenobacter sp. 15J16-1T3B]|uniref:pirin family protein n=1 Tax=Hymenobacter sp. 15J16-1T3B TaxID=2886941 RepID=UPI001D11EFA5|nr:pirin family protein [Hymenobacter sp. 15J16-1T3B]MCC3158011.1 pirin family protein [Hymenobacter sp. 15J16-1T3B]